MPVHRGGQVTKEVRAGEYRLSSYFLAKTAVSVPFESAVAVIFTVIIYNMIGFQAVAAKYLIFMAVLVLVNLISEMVGLIGGIVTKVGGHGCFFPATRDPARHSSPCAVFSSFQNRAGLAPERQACMLPAAMGWLPCMRCPLSLPHTRAETAGRVVPAACCRASGC